MVPVVYVIFDLLGLDGRLLLGRPWRERRARLEALQLAGPAWQTSPTFVDQGPRVWAVTGQQGLEGVVTKRLASPTCPGSAIRTGANAATNSRRCELVGWVRARHGRGGTAAGRRTPARRAVAACGHRYCRAGPSHTSAAGRAPGRVTHRHLPVRGAGQWGSLGWPLGRDAAAGVGAAGAGGVDRLPRAASLATRFPQRRWDPRAKLDT